MFCEARVSIAWLIAARAADRCPVYYCVVGHKQAARSDHNNRAVSLRWFAVYLLRKVVTIMALQAGLGSRRAVSCSSAAFFLARCVFIMVTRVSSPACLVLLSIRLRTPALRSLK